MCIAFALATVYMTATRQGNTLPKRGEDNKKPRQGRGRELAESLF
jgi:hypothetical protein